MFQYTSNHVIHGQIDVVYAWFTLPENLMQPIKTRSFFPAISDSAIVRRNKTKLPTYQYSATGPLQVGTQFIKIERVLNSGQKPYEKEVSRWQITEFEPLHVFSFVDLNVPDRESETRMEFEPKIDGTCITVTVNINEKTEKLLFTSMLATVSGILEDWLKGIIARAERTMHKPKTGP